MPAPRFSIVIPTYNRAALLPAAVESVLAQSDPDFELLVVDDGSTDDTAAVVAAFGDPRVRYEPRARGGVCAARNAGAAAARGELLVFLDSDDELVPHALARYRAAADTSGWDAVLAGRVQVAPDRRQWRTLLPEKLGFVPGAYAMTRDLFLAAGGFDEKLRYSENTEFGWRVRRHAATSGAVIGVVDDALVVVYARAGRAYDLAKYEAARQVLEEESDLLDSEIAGTAAPRKRRSSYQAIAGVSAAALGKHREALGYTFAALYNDPLSPARYRNLFGVLASGIGRRRRHAELAAVADEPPARRAHEVGAIHGIVVTFNRPESLAAMVDELAQTGLATLTVVDNAPSPESKDAAHRAGGRLATTYVPMSENSGPAGGYAAGMTRVLEHAADDDWVLVLDDDRLTGSIDTPRELSEFGAYLLNHGAPVGAVGQVGARFDRRRGRLLRLRDEELAGPVSVDYVAGGQMLMIRVAAVREVGTFDPELFFAFDDLDYCLRLAHNGYCVYAYGPAGLRARERFGRLGDVGRVSRRSNAWRRYYSVRNHIVVMRRYSSFPAAVAVTAAHLLGRVFVDLRNRQPDTAALFAAGVRGCIDAWTGRLGRQVDPAPGT